MQYTVGYLLATAWLLVPYTHHPLHLEFWDNPSLYSEDSIYHVIVFQKFNNIGYAYD